ncbi:hypothetical protein ALC62_09431 [Cyphomyrmex costatus]|uniref:Uncharacterized protein n=1 Tax=Cyphomyrmex costatus TaxID=456900 RepID=A0A195CIC1_9HYME|nr:hypothetical protein ALC62_09431 [Cyphomyrmex costatus]
MRHAESRKNDEEVSGGNASDRKDAVLNLQARRVRTSLVCRESQVIFHVREMNSLINRLLVSAFEVGSSVKLSNIIYLKRRTAVLRAAWMATNGILLYAMKKPLNDERTPGRIRNRLIGQKNAWDNESRCLMVIPPLSAIEDDTATRVSDNEWTYCR